MKTSASILLILILLLCSMTISSAAEFRKTKVAVVDFQENGTFDIKDVGKIVSEWFTTALVNTGRFDVIERRLLQQILEEQKMGVTGLIDPRSASRLGKLLGVKTVVSGTVQSYEGISEINVRLLNVETGSIITAESFKGGSTSGLNRLVNDAAAKIVRHFPLQGYVVKRSAEKVTIDLGGNAGVKPGMEFKVYTEGAPLKHPKTGEILSVETVDKGIIRITAPKENTSDTLIVSESCTSCIKTGQLVSAILLEDEAESQPVREAIPAAPVEQKPEKLVKAEPEKERNFLFFKRPEPEKALTPTVSGTYKTLSAHKSDVIAMAVSKNGQLAASADKDGMIDIWDLAGWTQMMTLHAPDNTKEVLALSFSSNSKLLAAAGKNNKVVIWDLASRQQAYALNIDDTVTSLDFYPAGTSIAIGTKKARIVIWNYKSNKISEIKAANDVLAVSVSPDGKFIASGGQDKNVTLWNAANGSQIRTMSGHTNDITALIFSPGGKQLISAGSDKKIFVWETASGSRKYDLSGHDDDVTALGISSDGHRLVSSESRRGGGILMVWDMKNGQAQKKINLSQRAYSMALTRDGRHVLTGTDKQVLVYALD